MTGANGRIPDGVVYTTVVVTDSQGAQRVLEHATQGRDFLPGALSQGGRSPDGLSASYAVFEHAAGHNTGDERFVSAKTCAPYRFVLVRNGATVGAARYEG